MSNSLPPDSTVATTSPAPPPSLLLLVWVHGFKGGEDTFGSFPDRVTFSCTETWTSTRVESLVYPPYDTRGSLAKAVELLLDYLTVKTSEREAVLAEELKFSGKGDGHRENAYIVLLGHSMGGLVVADATLQLLSSHQTNSTVKSKRQRRLWPHVIGVIGYDTPYFGLNPSVFANTAEEFYGHAKNAHQLYTAISAGLGAVGLTNSSQNKKKPVGALPAPPNSSSTSSTSSWWTMGMAAAGVAAAAGAAGAAYWQKDRITSNISWATSHLDFVGELWKSEVLNSRVESIISSQNDFKFHCFFTRIPASKTKGNENREFILPPKKKSNALTKFTANTNSKASNEIEAHTAMFTQASDGYWSLGDATTKLLSTWLDDVHQRRMRLDETRTETEPVTAATSDTEHVDEDKSKAAEEAKERLDQENVKEHQYAERRDSLQ